MTDTIEVTRCGNCGVVLNPEWAAHCLLCPVCDEIRNSEEDDDVN